MSPLATRLLGLLILLASFFPTQVHAENITLDFETLPGGGSPPFGMMLTTQYEPNVTFVPGGGGGSGALGGAEIRYCQPELGNQILCTHARSGRIVIVGVPDLVDEFLIHPIVMVFEQRQRLVSMYLKYPQGGDHHTIVATVAAYDADGNEVAKDTQTFGSTSDWRRFSVGSATGPANIARVVVTAAPSIGGEPAYTPNGWILVDDVTFEGEVPAGEADTTAPVVTVTASSNLVTRPETTFNVRVVEDYQLARVWAELIRSETGAAIRRYEICGPGVIACPPGPTGPSGANWTRTVTLPTSGEYRIRVTAEDTAGNRGEGQLTIVAQLPEEIRVSALRVEVNQSVQNGLLEVGPSGQHGIRATFIQPVAGKDTVVRYYLVGQGGTAENFSRSLRVTIWNRDGTTLSRTLAPNAGQRVVDVPAAPPPGSDEQFELLWEMRADLSRTLNFVIPGELLEDAERLGLELDTVTGQLIIPVRPPITLGIRTVAMIGRHVTPPREPDIEAIFRFVRAAFPVRDVLAPSRERWLSIPVPPGTTNLIGEPLFSRLLFVQDKQDCGELLSLLRSTYAGDSLPPGAPEYTVTLGLANSGFVKCAGLAYLHSPFGISLADTNVGPHEIVHTLNVEHASNDHGESDGGGYEEWPYPHGHISPNATLTNVERGYVFGILAQRAGGASTDTWDLRLVDPCAVRSFAQRNPCALGEPFEEHDFMSYGPWQPWTQRIFGRYAFRWLSDITHERIYNRIRDRASAAGGTAGASQAAGENGTENRQEALIVTGRINPDGTATLLTPLLRKPMPVSMLAQGGGQGSYRLELRDARGGVLLRRAFDVEKAVAADGSAEDHFWLAVDYVDGARELVISDGQRTLLRETASANPPLVRVTAPNGGENFPSGTMTVTWEASDPDGDSLTFLVQYSPDGGTSWQSITTVLPGQPRQVEVPVSAFMPGTRGIVRVMASDGFNTAYDVSDAPFRLGSVQGPAAGDPGLPRDVVRHWARDAIGELIAAGIILGYPDGTFRPDNSVTRAEFVAMLARTAGADLSIPGSSNFSDVHPGDWYAPAIAVAVQNNWVTGYPDGSFRPNATISRQEAAVIISRLLNVEERVEEARRFSDGGAIAPWAAGHVGAASRAGIITGYPDGSFRPAGAITRAETAVIISRSLSGLR